VAGPGRVGEGQLLDIDAAATVWTGREVLIWGFTPVDPAGDPNLLRQAGLPTTRPGGPGGGCPPGRRSSSRPRAATAGPSGAAGSCWSPASRRPTAEAGWWAAPTTRPATAGRSSRRHPARSARAWSTARWPGTATRWSWSPASPGSSGARSGSSPSPAATTPTGPAGPRWSVPPPRRPPAPGLDRRRRGRARHRHRPRPGRRPLAAPAHPALPSRPTPVRGRPRARPDPPRQPHQSRRNPAVRPRTSQAGTIGFRGECRGAEPPQW
jgi:hypothetical protein